MSAVDADALTRRDPPRTLVVGAQRIADSLEWHVMDTLEQMRVPVRFFQTHAGFGRFQRLSWAVNKVVSTALREPERLFETRLMAAVGEFQPALILVIQGSQLSPKTIARLRAASAATIVCWCQDQLAALGRQFMLGAGYDAVFVKDRYMQSLFARMISTTAFHYLPEACNPRVHHPVEPTPEEARRYGCDVMIAGTLYYYRQEILRHLSEFDLRVYGTRPSWLLDRLPAVHQGREVVLAEKAKAMRSARVCLNSLHFAEINSLNCRAFEIAGCGGFQLISRVPVLSEHFLPDEELATFDSAAELVDRVRYFLGHPQEAARIAHRGQLRAHRDHTYEHRLSQLLQISTGYQWQEPA